MPDFRLSFIAYSDITADSGNPLTNSTVSAAGSFTVQPGAQVQRLIYNDDEDVFHDAFIDPGTPQTLVNPITVNGTTYPAGSVVELEFSVSTTTGEDFVYIRVGGVNVGIGGTPFPVPGQSYTIQSSSDGQLRPIADLACFTAGTPVATVNGVRRVEDLEPGDQIKVFAGQTATLRTALRSELSLCRMLEMPRLAPVRFAAGVLGNACDLAFSPQHRIVIRGKPARRHFGVPKVLVPAKALINGTTITQPMPNAAVTYVHLVFDRHELVRTAGLWSESFLPTPRNVSNLPRDARRELLSIFPQVLSGDAPATALPARRVRESMGLASYYG